MRSISAAAALLLWLLVPAVASAYPDWTPTPQVPPPGHREGTPWQVAVDCNQCHSATSAGDTSNWDGGGPHGGYTTTTKKCALCHAVHAAPASSVLLLRSATVSGTCITCHDGTGSAIGVYTTIEAHGEAVASEHRVDVTGVIPGGSTELTGLLSCDNCHSVHASNTVAPFLRDSGRALAPDEFVVSDCLLRNDVRTGVVGSVPEYGAQWCAACHDERHSSSTSVRNHPVDADAAWGYGDIVSSVVVPPSLRLTASGSVTGLGRTNSGYVMAPVVATGDGRIEEGNRRAPICQQCHEDARDVQAVFNADYQDPASSVNPMFMTFPHQTTSRYMLLEQNDDLCLNCHAVATLP